MGLFVFMDYSFLNSLYILDIIPLSGIGLVKIFSQLSCPAGFSYLWVREEPQTWKEMGGRKRREETKKNTYRGLVYYAEVPSF